MGAGDEAELATFSLGIRIFDSLFSTLKSRSQKMYAHALHTVHAFA